MSRSSTAAAANGIENEGKKKPCLIKTTSNGCFFLHATQAKITGWWVNLKGDFELGY